MTRPGTRAQIYPSDIFERRRLYNVEVKRSRHPGLNEYIRETIYSLRPWIEGGHLEKLAILFYEEGCETVIERLVFTVKLLKEIEGGSPEHRIELEN